MDDLNFLAIAAAAVAYFALGAVWFTVLSDPWARGIGKTKAQVDEEAKTRNMGAVFGGNFVVGAVMFAIMATVLVSGVGVTNAGEGAAWAVAIAAIVELSRATSYLFERRTIAIWAIYAGYTFAGFAIGGAIIGAWL